MERYGEEIRLMENQLYTASIRIGGEEMAISFTSRYSPLFSSARLVKSDFKQLFSEIEADHVNRLIFENSKLAIELSETAFELDEVPHAAKQFVRYKTELDLATDLFLTLMASSGQYDRQLGDLRIVKQTQVTQAKAAIDILQKKVDAWEIQLAGMKAAPASSVRAGVNEYPIESRLSF